MGRQASAPNAKAGSWTAWDLEWLREDLGVAGVVCKWGRWGAGWGWDGGCVWGSRGTVRVQAEVVVLLGQG